MTTIQHPAEPIEGYRPRMTEIEFDAWARTTDVRAEWVQGEVILMPPANYDHWEFVHWLTMLMGLHASKHHLGKVGGTDFVNRLKGRRRLPDIFFVSLDRQSNFRQTYLEGPADLVVEVVSPDSQARDRDEKFSEYQTNGVREYWIIDPLSRHAEFFALQDGAYAPIATRDGIIRSTTLKGFWLQIDWLWQHPLPNEYETAKTVGII